MTNNKLGPEREAIHPRIRQAVSRLGLSPRETELTELVCRGIDTGTVCDLLDVTEATVRTHLRRIFADLGIGNRSQLVARVMDQVIEDLDSDRS